MYQALISGIPPDESSYEGYKISTVVGLKLLTGYLPWVIDADDSDVVRPGSGAPDAGEHQAEVRVPEIIAVDQQATFSTEYVSFVDISGKKGIKIPVCVMRQSSKPMEGTEEASEAKTQTLLTEKTLCHIAQILWGVRYTCHPSYSPEVVLESFVFFHHHNMWALAGRTRAWLRWFFIEHTHCPNDLLLSRAWQITTPGHPLRPLLLSSLWRRMAETPKSDTALLAFRNKFHVMYGPQDARWFIDLRPGSWFADFHAFFGKATGHQQALDTWLAVYGNVKTNRIHTHSIVSYIYGARDSLVRIHTQEVTVLPCVLNASEDIKSDYQKHMDAICAHVSQAEDYRAKALVEPESKLAEDLKHTDWELKGTKLGLVTLKSVREHCDRSTA